jgi:predicted Fe-Mo cluster-binding NifX family protein
MRICIPVNADAGAQSIICEHFGSSPMFMVVDTENGACRAITNRYLHHAHGMLQPLEALQGERPGERLDGVVVAGIGTGALMKLLAAGLSVYLAEHETVEKAMRALEAGRLQLVHIHAGSRRPSAFCPGSSPAASLPPSRPVRPFASRASSCSFAGHPGARP